jgi:predicted acyltransferase
MPNQLPTDPPTASVPSSTLTETRRVTSVDALRGFDMFWIIGGDALVEALYRMGTKNPILGALAHQVDHAKWEGFRFYDLIFPLFVFIIGVSLVYSLSRRIATSGQASASWQIVRRFLVLYLLGLFAYGGISKGVDGMRLLGVLQRLALCYLVAGLAFTWLKPRALVALCASLLVGYWALMTFVPVPGVGAGNFAEGANLANWVDSKYLPFFKWDGDHDPEGLLSTIPAIASCLLGVFAGLLLKNGTQSDLRKVQILIVAGLISLAAGWIWSLQFPVIKKIWTSSYVLVAAGWSAILLALFYLVIDVWKYQKWAAPFIWIGMNAITIYMLVHIVSMGNLANRIIGGEIRLSFDIVFGAGAGELLNAVVALTLCILIMRFLYNRKIFFKV